MAFVFKATRTTYTYIDIDRNLEFASDGGYGPLPELPNWPRYRVFYMHLIGDKQAYVGGACMVGESHRPLTPEEQAKYPDKTEMVTYTIFDDWYGATGSGGNGRILIDGYGFDESVETIKEALAVVHNSRNAILIEKWLYEIEVEPSFREEYKKWS